MRIRPHALDGQERRALEQASRGVEPPVPASVPALALTLRQQIAGDRGTLGRLARRVRRAVREPSTSGILHLTALPPVDHPTRLTLLLACLLGDPVPEHASRPWIKEVRGQAEASLDRPSAGDSGEFFLHTDLSYSPSPPPFFLLHSLCNRREEGGCTTLCPLAGLLPRLSAGARRELAQAQFAFPSPSYYPATGGVASAVLFEGQPTSPAIRFRRDGLSATSWSAMAAVVELVKIIAEETFEIHLCSGSVLFLDNRRWLHGRTAYLLAGVPEPRAL